MHTIPQNDRVSQPKITVEMTAKNLTVNAGLLPVIRYMDKLQVDRLLQELVKTPVRAENADYQFNDAVQMVILGQTAGATAMAHVTKVCGDGVVARMAGWETVPVATTITRIIKAVKERNLVELESIIPRLRGKVWKHLVRNGKRLACATQRILIDIDSTVQGVCGNQEGAEVGYNPHKKGQKAYHPVLAFCAETKEILHSWYRCGSAYTSNGCVEFLQELFAGLANGIRKVVRADSGYFSGEILDYLESLEAGYLIKVKFKNLNKLLSRQQWQLVAKMPGWEGTEFLHQCGTWSTKRKFVAVRKQIGISDDMFRTPIYDYFCYVTTETGTPMQIHRMYGKRATCETWIEECKSQMGAGYIRTDDFLANSVLFQCGVMAYNLLKWMALSIGGQIQKWEVKTIRLWLIRVAGKLTSGGRRLILKLPKNFMYQAEWAAWDKMAQEIVFA
jgi:hypothetical protein